MERIGQFEALANTAGALGNVPASTPQRGCRNAPSATPVPGSEPAISLSLSLSASLSWVLFFAVSLSFTLCSAGGAHMCSKALPG